MEEHSWSKVEHSKMPYGDELINKLANKLKNSPESTMLPGYSTCSWRIHSNLKY